MSRDDRTSDANADVRGSETLVDALVSFAVWIHPTWEQHNEDDAESARAAVSAFLANTNKEDNDG